MAYTLTKVENKRRVQKPLTFVLNKNESKEFFRKTITAHSPPLRGASSLDARGKPRKNAGRILQMRPA